MSNITYVGGMTPDTKKRCKKSITAILDKWIELTGLSGSFSFWHIRMTRFQRFQALSRSNSRGNFLCVCVPEAAKPGKFKLGSGIKGAECRLELTDGDLSVDDLTRCFADAISELENYFLVKKKVSTTEEVDHSSEVLPTVLARKPLAEVELPEACDIIKVGGFCQDLSAIERLYFLMFAMDKERAYDIVLRISVDNRAIFYQKICHIGLAKCDKTNVGDFFEDPVFCEDAFSQVLSFLCELVGPINDSDQGNDIHDYGNVAIEYIHGSLESLVVQRLGIQQNKEQVEKKVLELQREYERVQEDIKRLEHKTVVLQESITESRSQIQSCVSTVQVVESQSLLLREFQTMFDDCLADQKIRLDKQKQAREDEHTLAVLEGLAKSLGFTSVNEYVNSLE